MYTNVKKVKESKKMEKHKVFVDLLIESAKTYKTRKDLDYIGEFMPTDKNAISNVLSEIHERMGYQPQQDCMRQLNAHAEEVVSTTQYIEQSKGFLRNMMMINTYEYEAMKKAIRVAYQKRSESARDFVNAIVSDMMVEVINIHRDSIIYDIMGIIEKDNGIDVVMYAKHHGEEMIRSKYITKLDDIAELSESVYVNESTYDNFKKFKEVTRPVNTNMKSIYAYKKYKTPYSLKELETLLRNIYKANESRV